MTIRKTLGGDRLGSGKKMTVKLKNYGRSSHDLGRVWRSTMGVGTLVPFIIEPTLNGDTFDIDLTTLVRTLPTNGPVFGSFKLQLDLFSCPIRLYNAQLHNNKLGIGMEMDKVKFPILRLKGNNPDFTQGQLNQQQISQSSLLAYLGIRGLGTRSKIDGKGFVNREFNAMPLLMYWDIYKNYYANKQEEIGMVVNPEPVYGEAQVKWVWKNFNDENAMGELVDISQYQSYIINRGDRFRIIGPGITENNLYLKEVGIAEPYLMKSKFGNVNTIYGESENQVIFTYFTNETKEYERKGNITNNIIAVKQTGEDVTDVEIKLKSFDLSSIDWMREQILKHPSATPFVLESNPEYSLGEPYNSAIENDIYTEKQRTLKARYPLAGLGVKTYQSDRFNNWLSTEWIDGANGIAEITAVDTSEGSFTMDTLNLAKKVYDMLNRIAVSGGSYNDWQEAIWGDKVSGIATSPIFLGGLSSEIVFNEVVSTADAMADETQRQPLGTLAGRGTQNEGSFNGGKVVVRTSEPSFIMGIASITPRVDYSQGNKWWNRLRTMNDFHKPALDGIGFQELLTEELAAFDTKVNNENPEEFKEPIYKSAGKQPAWIHYMTAVSETYGNFADEYKEMYTTLNRRYEHDSEGNIKDLTTYIDPMKFNDAFADASRTAQNFWVQIGLDIIARRKMSAKQIPNL